MGKLPTIADVAKLAGVSKSTVSKYLNQVPYVSLDAQKRIEKAVKELDFSPNSLARGLVNKSTRLIGLVIGDVGILTNMELIKSIEIEANRQGYSLFLVSTGDENENEEKLTTILTERCQHLDGIIVAHVRDSVELSKLQQKFPNLVQVHRCLPTSPVDYVIIDGYVGGRLAVEYLHNLGHRRMAMVTGPSGIYQYRERTRGFREGLQEFGLLDQSVVVEGGQYLQDGYRAAESIMFEHAPTAIFTGSDMLAIGVLDAARNYGWKVPDDLSVIGFDNTFFSKYASVPLTTIDGRIKELGAGAVQLLVQRLQGKLEEGVQRIVLRPSLVVRDSAGVCKEEPGRVTR